MNIVALRAAGSVWLLPFAGWDPRALWETGPVCLPCHWEVHLELVLGAARWLCPGAPPPCDEAGDARGLLSWVSTWSPGPGGENGHQWSSSPWTLGVSLEEWPVAHISLAKGPGAPLCGEAKAGRMAGGTLGCTAGGGSCCLSRTWVPGCTPAARRVRGTPKRAAPPDGCPLQCPMQPRAAEPGPVAEVVGAGHSRQAGVCVSSADAARSSATASFFF